MDCFTWTVLCFYILMAFGFTPVYPSCTPLEEGSNTSLTCSFAVSATCPGTISWKVGEGRNQNHIVSCVASDEPYCINIGNSRYRGAITKSGSEFSSTVTIRGVTRKYSTSLERRWLCYPSMSCSNASVTVCEKMEIYALPESPTCSIELEKDQSNGTAYILVLCITNKVYLLSDCLFYLHQNDSQQQGDPIKIRGIKTGETDTKPVYYTSQCDKSYSITELGEGSHRFEVRMYPRVTDGENLSGVEMTPAGEMNLEISRLTFRHNGTTGLNVGDSVVLTCETTGYPPPSLTISTDGGTQLAYQNGVHVETVLSYEIPSLTCDDLGRFNCTSSNSGWSKSSWIDVNVICPPKFEKEPKGAIYLTIQVGGNGHNRMKIIGAYPKPSTTYSKLEKVKGQTYVAVPQRHYLYFEKNESASSVDVVCVTNFTDIKDEDYATYRVTVGNNVSALDYRIIVQADESFLTALVAGLCAAVALILIILGVVCFSMKNKKKKDKSADSEKPVQEDEESTRPLTQQQDEKNDVLNAYVDTDQNSQRSSVQRAATLPGNGNDVPLQEPASDYKRSKSVASSQV